MTYLDNNIVNVAIPAIQRSLHLSVSGLEWVVSPPAPRGHVPTRWERTGRGAS